MPHVLRLAAISCVMMAACVDTGHDPDADARSTHVSDLRSVDANATSSCEFVWLCEQDYCTPYYPYWAQANVQHMYCPDGSDTVLNVTGCSEGCF
jgi:hypothetical protein